MIKRIYAAHQRAWVAGLLLPSLFPLPMAIAAQDMARILDVTPAFIPINNAKELHVSTAGDISESMLTILPGGPFLRNTVTLHSPPTQWIAGNGRIIVGDNTHARIYAASSAAQIQPTLLSYANTMSEAQTLLAQNDHDIFSYDNSNTLFQYALDTGKLVRTIATGSVLQPGTLIASATNDLLCLADSDKHIAAITLTPSPRIQYANNAYAITAIQALKGECAIADESNALSIYGETQNQFTQHATLHTLSPIRALASSNDRLYLAHESLGFTIVERNDKQLTWLGSFNKLNRVTNIRVENNRAMVVDENNVLSLFNVEDPNKPILLSDYRVEHAVRDFAFGDGSVTALTADEINEIDFSVESVPAISNVGINLGGSRRSFLDNKTLYVADWFSGLQIYDVNDAKKPRLLSTYHSPGSPKGVIVRNGIAYVADDDHGLQIVDVSNRTQPHLIGHLDLAGLAYTMKLIGNELFVASHRGGFHIVDISDSSSPALIGSYDTPGKSWALSIKGDLAFIADDSAGVLVLDISQRDQPRLINQYDPGGFAEDIVIIDNLAYIAFFDLGLQVLDISNPQNIKLMGQLNPGGNARGIVIRDKRLYLASWEAGVHIIDISEPRAPRIVSQFDTNGSSWGLTVDGSLVYVMDWWGGIKILDIAKEQQPILLSEYQAGGIVHNISLAKNFALLADGDRGLQIYDVTNALNPVWATAVEIPGHAVDITNEGDIAYVAADDAGIFAVDISKPFEPQLKSQTRISHAAHMIAAANKRILVAEKHGRSQLLDAANLEAISVFDVNTRSIWRDGATLFALTDGNDIITIDTETDTQQRIHSTQTLDLAYSSKSHLIGYDTKNAQITLFTIENNRLVARSNLNTRHNVDNMLVQDDSVFLLDQQTGNVSTVVINSDSTLSEKTGYQSTHRITGMAKHGDNLFFSGEPVLFSLSLLPDIKQRIEKTGLAVQIPASMPMGAYHIAITDKNGKRDIRHNAFQIGFPKITKPKFTMEDLKKKMQQQNFSGKAP